MSTETRQSNRLAQETSPYLLQHCHNPVDWYPWGKEALQRAQQEQKPIFLSIGYSACHWCHVMERESFEHAEIAAVLNEHFVCIKVDREERPDLDEIYMAAAAALSGTGGWPLNVFLTPEGKPFFGGTYFPAEDGQGPGFLTLVRELGRVWQESRDDLVQQAERVVQRLRRQFRGSGAVLGLEPELLDQAVSQLAGRFDAKNGGFGGAPKFPAPSSLLLLLRYHARSQDPRVLEMITRSLDGMARGGIFDQLGGGFARYAVDDSWRVPHFEKMLYDNGPLLALYAQAHAATGNPLFARIAHETAAWVLREMQSPEGGFYSTLDADSEGEEGKFYVWTRDEARALLGDDYALFARRFGLDREPNFEGQYHLHVFTALPDLAREFSLREEDAARRLDAARAKLFAARSQRIWPGRDEKILTSWNGLMIRGLAIAARHLERPEYAAAATTALDFIRETLWRDGRLLATYKDGRAHLSAYLDDYVFLIDAILELLQMRWRDSDLRFAIELAEVVLDHFADPAGGFFFTADDHETLIQRPKPVNDDALPSGNGIAATVLGRLGHLLGETRYLDAAERTLKTLWPVIEQNAYACTALLLAAEEYLFPGQTVVLRGSGAALDEWRRHCARAYAPRRMSFAVPDDAIDPPGLLSERRPQGAVVAYVCTGTQCAPPAATLAELDALLM